MPDKPIEPETAEPELDAESDSAVMELEERIRGLEEEVAVAKDAALRAMAELQNARRRMEQEKAALRKRATEDMVMDLLPVLDNFERAVAAAEKVPDFDGLLSGAKAIDRQLRQVLGTHGVQRIESLGQPFDPQFHEAIGTVDAPDAEPGTIVAEAEPGYVMHDVVVRPARVQVARGS